MFPGKRLFVALWPSPVTRNALAGLARDIGAGKPVAAKHLHMTLAFLGNSTAVQEACYRSALAGLSLSAFLPLTLEINMMGYWFKPRVLWAGPRETPPALIALVDEVNRLLQSCGFKPDSRPFRAHVTLRRKYPGPMLARSDFPAISWRADTVALVESQSTPGGVRYVPLWHCTTAR